MVVLDASVILKWLYPPEHEPHADVALGLRARLLDGHLAVVVPAFAMYEAAHSLRHSAYRLAPSVVRARIRDLWALGLTVAPVSRRVLWAAAEMSFLYNVPVYDAYYFATAQFRDCPCITADQRAYTRVSSLPWILFLGHVRDVAAFDD